MAKEYRIRNITDIVNIPDNKMKEFLDDLEVSRALWKLVQISLPEGERLEDSIEMIWIDDNKKNVEIDLRIKGE